ncbi:unnamed protein product, partial [marine sediment metagenome]
MSKLFPIYKCGSPFKLLCNLKCNSDWLEDTHIINSNKMIIDNRPVDIILKNMKELLGKFRDKNKEIIGICGSDIVLNSKLPKWTPD